MSAGAWIARRLSEESVRLAHRHEPSLFGDRICSAAETVARMRPLLGRFGITRLADITGLDRIGIPVWSAIRPNARTIAVSQGKGIDASAAQASAVMEAVEMAVAERIELPATRSTAERLFALGEQAELLPDLIARGQNIPAPDEEVEWLAGYDIVQQQTAWLPLAALTIGQTHDGRAPPRYWSSTDGLASGNLLIEAALHGVLERIERDAAALWRLRSPTYVARRCICPASLGDAALSALTSRVEQAGFELRLFDMTTDIGVPAFFCIIAANMARSPHAWKRFDLVSGSGCHPDPARAAVRALTEAAQSRATIISGARDDFLPSLYEAPLPPDLLAYVNAKASKAPPVPQTGKFDGPAKLLGWVAERLEACGLGRVIVAPLSNPSEDYAVVKVVIPGLEHPSGARRIAAGTRALRLMLDFG